MLPPSRTSPPLPNGKFKVESTDPLINGLEFDTNKGNWLLVIDDGRREAHVFVTLDDAKAFLGEENRKYRLAHRRELF